MFSQVVNVDRSARAILFRFWGLSALSAIIVYRITVSRDTDLTRYLPVVPGIPRTVKRFLFLQVCAARVSDQSRSRSGFRDYTYTLC